MTMTLDKRIYEDRRIIFTCFTAENAKKYVGQQGFFADEMYAYHDLDHVDFRTLDRVDGDHVPFVAGDLCYQFFLPAEFVRPAEEKKWRPYTPAEFEDRFTIGRPIRFRRKGEVENERLLILNGYMTDKTTYYVYIGSNPYTLDELFNEYEWQSHYTEDYQPFGVEE